MKHSGSVRWHSLLSPAGLLVRAAAILLFFLAAHLLGFREKTSIACATMPGGAAPAALQVVLGVIYMVLYLLAVLLAPVLILAAGMYAALGRLRPPARGVGAHPLA